MTGRRRLAALVLVALAPLAAAQDPSAALAKRLVALDADPATTAAAAYERLKARQAVQALAAARGRARADAQYVAERRVETAEVAARAEVVQRDVDRLERERTELLVEASRQDAARARAEADRLRLEAQAQAEEAARLREEAAARQAAIADIEGALTGIEGAQAARRDAARDREAALARKEAELVAGRPVPPSRREPRGEVFTLAGDAFATGASELTGPARTAVAAIGAYLAAMPATRVRVEGHTDAQGAAAANQALSERRAGAVRDALRAAGVDAARITVEGLGATRPVADNGSPDGRARNRRVELVVSSN